MGTITHGNITYTWTGSEPSGHFVDGPPYIVVGAGSVNVDQPTPVQTTNLGGVVHGAQLNPIYIQFGKQGFCQHANDWDASLTQTSWPVSMSAGDNLAKVISRTDTPGSDGQVSSWDNGARRAGVNVETSSLSVVNLQPDAETFAPPISTGTNGALPWKQTRFADLDAMVASLPNWDVSSISANIPPFATLMLGFDVYTPLCVQTPGATTGQGYQSALPFQWNNQNSNYGRESIRFTDAASLFLISNAANAAEKKQILIRMLSHGAQWHEGYKAGGYIPGGNGAHHQFGFMPMMWYLWAINGDFNDMLTHTPCHQLAQTFYLTQSHLDNELTEFHSNSAWSMSTRARDIKSVLGTRHYSLQGGLPGDSANTRMLGAILKRQSDGGTAFVTSVPTGGEIIIDADLNPPLAANDTVCFLFDHPDGYAVGQGHWGIGTSQAVKNWGSFAIGKDASYRDLQFWAGGLITCEAMGWTAFNGYDGFKAYVEACNGYNTGNATRIPWEDHHQEVLGYHFSENFWNLHYAAIEGTPPPSLPTMPANGTITLSTTSS